MVADGTGSQLDVYKRQVTDGPYLFRTGTGRLGMIWTSWIYNVYTQGVAYSESGTLDVYKRQVYDSSNYPMTKSCVFGVNLTF